MSAERVFACKHCLHCCFFARVEECPVIFSWEKRAIIEYSERLGVPLLNSRFEPLEVYRRGSECVVLLYRWVIRGYCPFYDITSRSCMIHEVKPLACRMYPLILEVPTGRLSVSGACSWVEENEWVVKAGDKLHEVFPSEFRAAVEVYANYMEAVDLLTSEGFVKSDGVNGCSKLIDFEEFVGEGGEGGEEETRG